MKNIILILLISSLSLFAGTLRILNIPVNSTIMIDNEKEYFNENKRSMNIELEDATFSYNIKILNKYFLPYDFNANISNEKISIHTLEMKYARHFYTNILVKDAQGNFDGCINFTCTVEFGKRITDNLYKYSENTENTNVDFSVSAVNYYDETDTYNINKNQLITIAPVSSWGLFSLAYIASNYPADENLKLTNESDNSQFMKYLLEETLMQGARFSYKKNTIFDFYLGMDISYMRAKETYGETDDDPSDGKVFTGVPTINYGIIGVSIGYRIGSLFLEGGLREDVISISKTFADDTTWKFTEMKTTGFVSADYILFQQKYQAQHLGGGVAVGLSISSDLLPVASIQMMF